MILTTYWYIKTENQAPGNFYIQALDLNGKAINKCWIPREDLMKGGTLNFTMGPEPKLDWGIGHTSPFHAILCIC